MLGVVLGRVWKLGRLYRAVNRLRSDILAALDIGILRLVGELGAMAVGIVLRRRGRRKGVSHGLGKRSTSLKVLEI